MRIGLVSPYDLSEPGGVQAQVLGLGDRLRSLGESVSVMAPGLPPGVTGADLGGTIRLPANGSTAPVSLDPRVGRLIREASRELDVLHVHEPLMPLVAPLANRAGPPVVATFHASPPRWVAGLYARLPGLVERLLANTVRVTAVSEVAAEPLPEGLRVDIVPNGIDVSAFPRSSTRRPASVAFLGRDEPRKGLDVLLAAWPSISSRHPESTLVVMNAQRQVNGPVWMGRVDEGKKAAVLSETGIFVAPHLRGESFGIVVAEAMAAGCAVVASALPAFRAVAGDAAVYFEPGDAAALASAVISLIEDDEFREELTARAVERVERFDWPVVISSYRLIYAEAVGHRS